MSLWMWDHPTGKCIGWHNLTEEQYREKLAIWEEKTKIKKERN